MRKIFTLLLLVAPLCLAPVLAQQKKATQKKQSTTAIKKKPAPVSRKGTSAQKTQPSKVKAGMIPANKVDTFKLQVIPIVKFYESTLNFLADKRNPVNEKQVIITQSYLKFCWDENVQVEDDLDDNRLVPLYKDMPAYLTDVDFFFKGAKFKYVVQDVSVLANQQGLTYFKVTANRSLVGLTLNGDSIHSNKVRYIELNYDSVKQDLKIVSVYTTKLNEKDDLRRWWNGLSQGWKESLAQDMMVGDNLKLAQVETYNDTMALIGGQKKFIDGGLFYQSLNQIVHSTSIDLSGTTDISNLEPLIKLSDLTDVNISGTSVSDLMPLRNLNKLEVLDLSNTAVSSLEPLRYCTRLRELRMKATQITDLAILPGFPALEALDISNTKVADLTPLQDVASLKELRLKSTSIANLTPIAVLTNLELLNFSNTPLSSLDPLKNMMKLSILQFDSTNVRDLSPLYGLEGLQRVFCDQSKVTSMEVVRFLQKRPNVSVVYQSTFLIKWWSTLSPDWQKIFNFYTTLSDPPTTEQLHKLALTDSINLNGRATVNSLVPLRALSMLRTLQCQSTGVVDLGPISELSELKVLNGSNTKITSLTPLSKLNKLEFLQLDNTLVSDLRPLDGLPNLKMIWGDNAQITLNEANRFLDKTPGCLVVFQTYENTNWWKNLSQPWKDVLLQQLSFKGTPDKIQLQQISDLEKFEVAENASISDLTPVQHLSRLKELQFSGTAVNKLDPVTQITSLVAIRCPKNPVNDLAPVTGLPNLKELDFSNTQVEDLMALQNMMKMEILKFSGTPIKNLKYLQKLTNLRVLEFFNTRVSNIDVLEELPRLESVKMFNTKVSAKKVEKLKALYPKCEIVFY
ncbi:MAG: hypothetical protein M0P47_06265 [Bacteroidales bacterium]|nr:hypothetical protein [Bacteroidales bacterium]